MIPFYFGSSQRRLFGAFHPAASEVAPTQGVVLCNPFGHEAIRTHRLYRVLADRLSRSGTPVMRFDYFGTGDSQGDDQDGDLDGWSGDLLTAHQELLRRAPVERVVWVGARLGALVAIRATHAAAATGSRLLVWDPVVDGPAYLKLMRSNHIDALEISFSLPEPSWRAAPESPDDTFAGESIGFALPPRLREQLGNTRVDTLAVNGMPRVDAVFDPLDSSITQWVEGQRRSGVDIRAVPLRHNLVWTSDDSLNSALVPAEAVQKLMSTLHE